MSTTEHTESEDATLAQLRDAETDLDLFKLSGDIDDLLLDASLDEYQQYLDQLDAARSHLDTLLADTAATLDELSEISASFKAIDAQTKAFQERSANILEEQHKNDTIAQDIADNLRYYEPLERITRRLNAPGAGAFVRSKDFSDMLITLDECIDYMQTHPGHKEAETYRSRYRLLLTRALTLVRNTFMAGVRETTTEVAGRIAAKQLNDTTMSALLYAKFRVGAAEMKELGLEIHKRANPPADADPATEGEYQSLMNELHSSFAACRARLILPIVQKRLTEIGQAPSSKDLVQFSRASISYIRGMCLDEFELWSEWFHGYRGLYDFLESICEPLYDHLRPRIIHENKLSKLCSLVTLLQTRYLHDEEEDGPADLNQLDFSMLIQPALEDAQTRLVFRAQAILRDEIEMFKPKPEDLDYPHRTSAPPTTSTPLSGRRKTREPMTPLLKSPEIVDEDSGEEGSFSWTLASRRAELQNCYPTLSKAIRLLHRIYRLVNSSVFDDLAHQIVHQTTVSLHNASVQISSKSSPADGQLFLLRHLLLLKSQIVAFDIEYVTPDVSFDFSGVASTFYELRERGGLFNPRSWMRLFSSGGLIPRVVENMLDAKVELDGRLRTVINDFTAGFATDMTKDLPRDVEKASVKNNALELAVSATRKHVEKEIPILRAKLEQYLDDMRTRETLVAAVEDQVVQIYEAFFDAYVNRFGGGGGGGGKMNGGSQISRKGKGPENAVWDFDTFAEWADSMFNVALPNVDDDGMSHPASRSLSRSGST
ncbi:Golgi transport complex subunit 3 [Exophiala xenobiotica]|nr:Golgi transport complex subunit 3 [Exophiala xenobiotica]KAK5374760.1 Golgi transport complex subunit 3 [Exophiala xenobiotica]KAK5396911.1 Golgi transport complex subunit 3 [Exophiala xenobiotica]KAK5410680.1 Golgi transport complex subunit 3 [Exophiala xenobiotica]KAK5470790.1 Golgi transport complex subunit 3 [Exophiala xenobiotica]